MAPLLSLGLASIVLLAAHGSVRAVVDSVRSARAWREAITRTGKSWKGRTTPWLGERGSVEAWGLLVLLALASLMLYQVGEWEVRLKEVRRHHKLALCLKELINDTHRLVARVNRINGVLTAGEGASLAGLFLPGGVLARGSWEKTKRALMAAQDAAWGVSQVTRLKLVRQGCPNAGHPWPSPYRWRTHGLERTAGGVAKVVSRSGHARWATPLVSYAVSWRLEHSLDARMDWEVR